jgi:hypothetical protein
MTETVLLFSCPPVLHIYRVPPSLPYALAAPSFRFRHLASLAGRAPIGGAREVALACFVAARLAHECTRDLDEDRDARAARCAGAKAWLGTLALPVAVRTPVVRCADLSVDGQAAPVAKEIAALAAAATSYLDPQSRAELNALSVSLKG